MANIKISPKQLTQILLDHLNPNKYKIEKDKRSLFIWGQMGIGKSEIVEQCTKFYNGKLIDLRLSQYDPTDIRGFPIYDKETGKMRWAQSEELPDIFEAEQYVLITLFLDEMNSANPAVQAAAYQLVHNRRIGNYVLPKNVRIVAAGNREGDRGVTYTMPQPLSNRFMHYNLEASFDDWFEWAVANNVTKTVLGYLAWAKQDLNTWNSNNQDNAYATPRTWDFANGYAKQYEAGEISHELFMLYVGGCLGEGIQTQLEAYIKMHDKLPKTEAILSGEETKIDEDAVEMGGVYATVINCCFALRDMNGKPVLAKSFENFVTFCMDNLKPELVVFAFTQVLSVFNVNIVFKDIAPKVLNRIAKDYATLLSDKNLK